MAYERAQEQLDARGRILVLPELRNEDGCGRMKTTLIVILCTVLFFIISMFVYVIYQHIKFNIRWRKIEKQRRNKEKDEGKS